MGDAAPIASSKFRLVDAEKEEAGLGNRIESSYWYRRVSNLSGKPLGARQSGWQDRARENLRCQLKRRSVKTTDSDSALSGISESVEGSEGESTQLLACASYLWGLSTDW
jgi:hypothetical protein